MPQRPAEPRAARVTSWAPAESFAARAASRPARATPRPWAPAAGRRTRPPSSGVRLVPLAWCDRPAVRLRRGFLRERRPRGAPGSSTGAAATSLRSCGGASSSNRPAPPLWANASARPRAPSCEGVARAGGRQRGGRPAVPQVRWAGARGAAVRKSRPALCPWRTFHRLGVSLARKSAPRPRPAARPRPGVLPSPAPRPRPLTLSHRRDVPASPRSGSLCLEGERRAEGLSNVPVRPALALPGAARCRAHSPRAESAPRRVPVALPGRVERSDPVRCASPPVGNPCVRWRQVSCRKPAKARATVFA